VCTWNYLVLCKLLVRILVFQLYFIIILKVNVRLLADELTHKLHRFTSALKMAKN